MTPTGAARLPEYAESCQAWRRVLTVLGERPEPRSPGSGSVTEVTASRFVVQLHDATTLHFDLRIQAGPVLRSWAVPKGPSLDPTVRRLAVPVEDHTLAAGEFEGVHPGARRGTGAVIIWDEGAADITRGRAGPSVVRGASAASVQRKGHADRSPGCTLSHLGGV